MNRLTAATQSKRRRDAVDKKISYCQSTHGRHGMPASAGDASRQPDGGSRTLDAVDGRSLPLPCVGFVSLSLVIIPVNSGGRGLLAFLAESRGHVVGAGPLDVTH